jgi:NADH dehydrogenase (ubiquinone) 1 beta subcomplex subunit 8
VGDFVRVGGVSAGLLPGDYKVNDDKDVNFAHSGDYPDLGDVTYAHKDPYETWSDPRFRRNWGEPVSVLRAHSTHEDIL